MFSQNVERHRQAVEWERRNVPAAALLAVIETESGGVPGIESTTLSRAADLPLDGGGTKRADRDLGLCQINPKTAVTYNAQGFEPRITHDDLTGQDDRAVRQQIRVGAWYLAWIVAQLHRLDPVVFPGVLLPENADHCRFVFAAYASGLAALREKIDSLTAGRHAVKWSAIARSWPSWAGVKAADRKYAALVRGLAGGPGALAVKGAGKGNLPDWLPVALAIGGAWLLKSMAARKAAEQQAIANPEDEDEDEDDQVDPGVPDVGFERRSGF